MIFDYYGNDIQRKKPEFSRLIRIQEELNKANNLKRSLENEKRRSNNWDFRKDNELKNAISQIKILRNDIDVLTRNLNSSNPSLFYHYLKQNGDHAEDLKYSWKNNFLSDPEFPINSLIDKKLWDYSKKFRIPDLDISLLPPLSILIQFHIKLLSPLISRDDREFYIIDNPMRFDKTVGLPYLSASSLKGVFKSKTRDLAPDQVESLFGPDTNEITELNANAGRLKFFPLFFKELSLELINPQDRKRSAASKNMATIECVPKGAGSLFTLLYTPFDLIPVKASDHAAIISDLETLSKIVPRVFNDGLGAKTSSEFGRAKILNGGLVIKGQIENKPFWYDEFSNTKSHERSFDELMELGIAKIESLTCERTGD